MKTQTKKQKEVKQLPDKTIQKKDFDKLLQSMLQTKKVVEKDLQKK